MDYTTVVFARVAQLEADASLVRGCLAGLPAHHTASNTDWRNQSRDLLERAKAHLDAALALYRRKLVPDDEEVA